MKWLAPKVSCNQLLEGGMREPSCISFFEALMVLQQLSYMHGIAMWPLAIDCPWVSGRGGISYSLSTLSEATEFVDLRKVLFPQFRDFQLAQPVHDPLNLRTKPSRFSRVAR